MFMNRKAFQALLKGVDREREAHLSEIQFLREQVQTLNDRLMAFSEGAFNSFKTAQAFEGPPTPQVHLDFLRGKIEDMEATTEEEKLQKSQALDEIKSILGF